jgi:hypothetical protein
VTKYDRVIARGGPPPEQVDRVADTHFGMTRHALAQHVPHAGLFAVSAFGPGAVGDRPPAELHPLGLDGPLLWLAKELEAIDRDTLEWLWDLVPHDLARLERCVRAYAVRYPRSERLADYADRLDALRGRARRQRLLGAVGAVALVLAGLAGYDAWGYQAARRFGRTEPAAVAVQQRWQRFLAWHPTHPLFYPAQARQARDELRQWTVRAAAQRIEAGTAGPEIARTLDPLKEADPKLVEPIRQVQAAAAEREHDARWQRVLAGDQAPGIDPRERLDAYRGFLSAFPESRHRAEAQQRIDALGATLADQQARSELQEVEALRRALALPDPDLADISEQAQRFLVDHPESTWGSEVQSLIESVAARIDAADIQKARDFSTNYPGSHATRRRKYEEYLAAHASGGRYTREAIEAIEAIDRERDVGLYRKAYDHAAAYPRDVPAIAQLLQAYLDALPEGQFAAAARSYLAWWEQVRQPGDYRVSLRRGRVGEGVGKYFSGGGPDLAVELWVNGVRYGPSPTAPNTRDPVWNHTFRQPVRWKYGDPVSIRILDHDWSTAGTPVYTLRSAADDPLGLRLLTGEVRSASGDRTLLVFESDFKIPRLPRPETGTSGSP